MSDKSAGRRRPARAWLIGGGLSLAAGLAVLGLVTASVIERARSGSDAARFNVSLPPGDLAEQLGQVASSDALPPAPAPAAQAATSGAYPGDRINPKYWDEPLWAGSAPFGGPAVPEGFEPVSARDLALAPAATATATRLRIDAIGLNSAVAPLKILNLADQRQYETPVNTVGFIPETSLPGGPGAGWYFGHLESFIRGEGSVFNRLPEVADLIREDPVDVVIGTADAEYLYRVTGTRQVHWTDLAIAPSALAEVTLVTCWPPRVYDRRILVRAELIAVKRLS